MPDWNSHFYRTGPHIFETRDDPSGDAEAHRRKIEPWLSAVFQSEHLSVLIGSGFTAGIGSACSTAVAGMDKITFACALAAEVDAYAQASAKRCGRGKANIEDQIRAANQLIAGLYVAGDARADEWRKALGLELKAFLGRILASESAIESALAKNDESAFRAESLLVSFLLSFASRAASRERLNLFTTNYDRLIEYGCDRAGLHILDRFVGHLRPVFRASRLTLDLHYNPPGIRGEPRYMEGVIRLTKLHGSLDWRWEQRELRRYGIPFGAPASHPDVPKEPLDSVMIYPNPAKDVETLDYPYSELFRDLCAALCRPNSALVTFGYGFGDDHINRVLRDMLTIPSSHLVIIAYGDPEKRVQGFCNEIGRNAQISILYGNHFGSLPDLVDHYLPKPAIDPISGRRAELLKNRGLDPASMTATTHDPKPPTPTTA
jgi:hypothetical protein